MVQVKEGLKELSKPDNLPEGDDYTLKIERIGVTKKGNGEGAFCRVVKGPEGSANRMAYLYLLNYETGASFGLSQLLKSLKLENVPNGPHGKQDTQNLVGAEFSATISTRVDKETQQDRDSVTPNYDTEWWNSLLSDETPKGRSRKKKG